MCEFLPVACLSPLVSSAVRCLVFAESSPVPGTFSSLWSSTKRSQNSDSEREAFINPRGATYRVSRKPSPVELLMEMEDGDWERLMKFALDHNSNEERGSDNRKMITKGYGAAQGGTG